MYLLTYLHWEVLTQRLRVRHTLTIDQPHECWIQKMTNSLREKRQLLNELPSDCMMTTHGHVVIAHLCHTTTHTCSNHRMPCTNQDSCATSTKQTLQLHEKKYTVGFHQHGNL